MENCSIEHAHIVFYGALLLGYKVGKARQKKIMIASDFGHFIQL